jgi:hypothetical protein
LGFFSFSQTNTSKTSSSTATATRPPTITANPEEKIAAIAQIDRTIAKFNEYALGNSELQFSEAFRTLFQADNGENPDVNRLLDE